LRKDGAALGYENVAVTTKAMEILQQFSWPGNVRELENAVRQAMLLSHGYTISVEVVGEVLAKNQRQSAVDAESCRSMVIDALGAAQRGEVEGVYDILLRRLERELFAQAITLAGGNQAKAARWLGISRVTMREKLRQYGLKSSSEESVAAQ
jgi:DNA-binding NtrC family response regulator